jgi:hypothetical protein
MTCDMFPGYETWTLLTSMLHFVRGFDLYLGEMAVAALRSGGTFSAMHT